MNKFQKVIIGSILEALIILILLLATSENNGFFLVGLMLIAYSMIYYGLLGISLQSAKSTLLNIKVAQFNNPSTFDENELTEVENELKVAERKVMVKSIFYSIYMIIGFIIAVSS